MARKRNFALTLLVQSGLLFPYGVGMNTLVVSEDADDGFYGVYDPDGKCITLRASRDDANRFVLEAPEGLTDLTVKKWTGETVWEI